MSKGAAPSGRAILASRLVWIAGVDLITFAVSAMIDPAFAAENAIWFAIVGAVAMFGAWLWKWGMETRALAASAHLAFQPQELDRHLSADRAEALRELAKLRRAGLASSFEEILSSRDRLFELVDIIGLTKEEQNYAWQFGHHNYMYRCALHTMADTPENDEWKARAQAYHHNMMQAYALALDAALRGREAKADLLKRIEQAGEPPPEAGSQAWAPDASQDRFMLLRTTPAPEQEPRRWLIEEGRALILGFDENKESPREYLDRQPVFLRLRKYLSPAYMRLYNSDVHRLARLGGRVRHSLITNLSDELDRLETEWGLDLA